MSLPSSSKPPFAAAGAPALPMSAARLAPVRQVLANGAVVTAKQTRKTPAVTFNVAVGAGTVADSPDSLGAAYLLSRVIDRGTATRTADELAEALESRGTSLALAVNRHQLSIVCTCLAADFDPVFDVIGEILMSPTTPENELELRKGEVLTLLAQDEDSPYIKAAQELLSLLYGPTHPYGRPAKGTAESVSALTRAQVRSLHRERVVPSMLSAVVVGDVDPQRVIESAVRVLGAWNVPPSPAPWVPSPEPATCRRRRVVPMMNKAQADIAYGFTGIRRSDPAYYACALMNNILGQYALGGRLGDSIRERQGMAYYVSSGIDANLIEGPVMIRAGVSPGNVDRAIDSIDTELQRMRAEGPTARELAESRQYLIGSMPRALETNAGIAGFLQNAEFFGLGLDYDVRLAEYLGAVTLEEVHDAARRLLDPDRASIVIAGPYDEVA